MPRNRSGSPAQEKKLIALTIRFWTNNIPRGSRNLRPKHAWSSGYVRLDANASHGIRRAKTVMFDSLAELGSAIEKSLIEGGIRLHPSPKTKRYWAEPSDRAGEGEKSRR